VTPRRIALLGAESTGKTTLSLQLAAHWQAHGLQVEVVPEVLREWCHREGRTPRPHEQLPIAREQERRVDEAASRASIVISDTSALMVAIYSAMLFDDPTLYPYALERQRNYDATLLTGLDIPWVADAHLRDGPHVREPVDLHVRTALQDAGIPFGVVYGTESGRLASALSAVERLTALPGPGTPDTRVTARWNASCEKCSDPECEHRLFSRLF